MKPRPFLSNRSVRQPTEVPTAHPSPAGYTGYTRLCSKSSRTTTTPRSVQMNSKRIDVNHGSTQRQNIDFKRKQSDLLNCDQARQAGCNNRSTSEESLVCTKYLPCSGPHQVNPLLAEAGSTLNLVATAASLETRSYTNSPLVKLELSARQQLLTACGCGSKLPISTKQLQPDSSGGVLPLSILQEGFERRKLRKRVAFSNSLESSEDSRSSSTDERST